MRGGLLAERDQGRRQLRRHVRRQLGRSNDSDRFENGSVNLRGTLPEHGPVHEQQRNHGLNGNYLGQVFPIETTFSDVDGASVTTSPLNHQGITTTGQSTPPLRPVPGVRGGCGPHHAGDHRYFHNLHPGDRGRLPFRRDHGGRGDVFRGGERARHAVCRAGRQAARPRSPITNPEAAYVRGSGTDKLVFAWTVPSRPEGRERHPASFRSAAAERRHDNVTDSDGITAVWNLAA